MTDFTVVALADTFASGVTTSVDLLVAASALARAEGVSSPSWRVASVSGGELSLAPAFTVMTERLLNDRSDKSMWIIPTISISTNVDADGSARPSEVPDVAMLVRAHIERGGHVAASSSAVLILENAGVISKRRVAGSRAVAAVLEQLGSTACVDYERILCVDGPITSCSAPLALSGLIVHLINQLCGPRFAETLARTWLHPIEAGFPLSNLLVSHESRNTLVAKLVEKVEKSLPETPSVTQLAFDLEVSERTLSRYVRSVTGKSTRALVQDVKLRRARTLLESSRLSVDRIAAAVGYSDSTALRRLMKKITGTQPSRYRMACLPG